MNCPHCGAEEKEVKDNARIFSCGTIRAISGAVGCREYGCLYRQISALKSELEEAKNKAFTLEYGKYGTRHLTDQIVGLKADLSRQRAALEKATAENSRHSQLLRELFYARTPLGNKVEDLIFEWDKPLHHRITEALSQN